MSKIIKVSKNEINLPLSVVVIGLCIILYHIFSYMIPVTNNAFVVTNVAPIAADVSGYITKVYVKNGQQVKKDQPLIEVYQEPYRLVYEYAKSMYEKNIEQLYVIDKKTKKTQELLKAAIFDEDKAKLEYQLKNAPSVRQAVPALEIKLLNYRWQSFQKKKQALRKQIEIEEQQIRAKRKEIKALKAAMDKAKVDLDLTVVRAPLDGVVDNLYLSPGTPVKIRTPLFSFIDTKNWWIQANFNETDLRRIRPGDEAIIILRMYYFHKIFHGRVENTVWASSRQETSQRSQQQRVKSENEWLLIPQRLPLQIKILDPDPNYPLQPGASAYVYLKAHTHH